MSRPLDAEPRTHKITIRVSDAAYEALKLIRREKGGSVTSRAQEIVEASRHVTAKNYHKALAAFEDRGRE